MNRRFSTFKFFIETLPYDIIHLVLDYTDRKVAIHYPGYERSKVILKDELKQNQEKVRERISVMRKEFNFLSLFSQPAGNIIPPPTCNLNENCNISFEGLANYVLAERNAYAHKIDIIHDLALFVIGPFELFFCYFHDRVKKVWIKQLEFKRKLLLAFSIILLIVMVLCLVVLILFVIRSIADLEKMSMRYVRRKLKALYHERKQIKDDLLLAKF